MKIGVTSDTHFGHSAKTHRVHERFLKEFSEACVEEDVGVVVHCGDWSSHNQHQIPRTFKMFREALGDLPILGVKGNHDCLDKETELLTKRGWLRYTQILKSDKILSINNDGFSEWSKINKIIIKKSNKMFKYTNRNLDMCVTENHRIIHNKQLNRKDMGGKFYSELQYSTILDMKKGRYSLPLARANDNLDYPISDNEIKFLAWVFTDGSRGSGCQIWQSKKKYVKEIKKLLDSLGYNYSFSTRNRDIKSICGKELKKKPLPSSNFNIFSESLTFVRKWIDKKREPINPERFNKFSKRQLVLFLRTLMSGDGSFCSRGYDAGALDGKKEVLGWFQMLAAQCGVSSSIIEYRKGTFRLNLNFSKDYVQIDNLGKKAEEVVYNDMVWCLSVPYTNFMVRRNGKAYFTGNCWDFDYWGIPPLQRKWAKHPAGMNHGEMVVQHKEWAKEFGIELLDRDWSYRFDKDGKNDTVFYGFNGWYNLIPPNSNDSTYMVKFQESAPIHTYLNNKAGGDLEWILEDVEYLDKHPDVKRVCATHFPPYSKNGGMEWCANPRYLDFITEKFDLLLVGHSHSTEDWENEYVYGNNVHKCRVVNAGTKWDKNKQGYDNPNFVIVEV